VVRLPAGGRSGRTPKWPLPSNPRLQAKIEIEQELIEVLEEMELADDGLSKADSAKLTRARQRLKIAEVEKREIEATEKALWREVWKTPQAAEWERQSWTRDVAQYVRHKAAAECGSMDDSKEARLRGEALGLTPKGLKALMWVIDYDEVGAQRATRKPTAATGTDGAAGPARRRLRAVDKKD